VTVLVHVTRGGVVESVHRGRLALCDLSGDVLARVGDAGEAVYARSTLKPFQTVVSAGLLEGAGLALDQRALAIASASHSGSAEHQAEAARILRRAGLDVAALRCPPDWPLDDEARRRADGPTRLAYNCSGKHAAFLWAHTAGGGDPARYLDPDVPLQGGVPALLAELSGASPQGPGVDGCGAPAWRLPVTAIATAFARLAAGDAPGAAGLARVRDAMVAHPHLVGHATAPDTQLMQAVPGLVAKRGAEGVLAAGWSAGGRTVGAAVKIEDGAARAAAVTIAAIVAATGPAVPDALLRPAVLGGGLPQGAVEAVLPAGVLAGR
jgi:L-asparaginase II